MAATLSLVGHVPSVNCSFSGSVSSPALSDTCTATVSLCGKLQRRQSLKSLSHVSPSQLRWRTIANSKSSPFSSPTMSLTDFAKQETSKFLEEFPKLLASEGVNADSQDKVTAVCSEVIREYAESYTGTLDPVPFAKMKERLEKEGLPAQKVLPAAIGWARTNLYYDWKKWSK